MLFFNFETFGRKGKEHCLDPALYGILVVRRYVAGWSEPFMLKIAVLSISVLIISFVSVAGIFPALSYALNLTQLQSELLMTIPGVAVILTLFISNGLVKKIGMKKTVIIGMLVSGIAGIFPTFVASYVPILVSRFFLGVGVGLVNTWAVRYITLLFDEKERATLMGFRSSVEIIGQSMVALLASFLFQFGWRYGFLAYGIAFISAILVLIYVPEIEISEDKNVTEGKTKVPKVVYLMAMFCGMIVVVGPTIAFRYPAMAVEIRGMDYNPNLMMGIWPFASVVAAMSFGKLSKWLGEKLIYLSLVILIAASFITGFSNGSYLLLVIGLFLHGVVPAWFFPFVFTTTAKMTSGHTQSMAFTCVVVGIKSGLVLIPFVTNGIETLLGTTELTAPFPIFGGAMILSTIFIGTVGKQLVRHAIRDHRLKA